MKRVSLAVCGIFLILVSTSMVSGTTNNAKAQSTGPTPPPASDCVGTGSGNRVITGTPNPDTLIGTSINNLITGLGGDDKINGCDGNDSISGNAGNDGIAGGTGNDQLNGNEGDDLIQGDSGNDLLSGGSGINTLTGGPGRDSFVCSPDGETTVTDFVPGIDTMSGPCIEPPTAGFSVTGTGETPVILCGPISIRGTDGELEFSAEEGTDGTVTGTFNLQFNGGGTPVIVDGTFTDGTTDGNTFTLSGEHSVILCLPPVDPILFTVSGDCGDDVTISYEDNQAITAEFIADIECTLT